MPVLSVNEIDLRRPGFKFCWRQACGHPFTGRNQFFDGKTTFYIFFSHKMYKIMQETTKKTFIACFCVAFLSFFSISDGKIWKNLFIQKNIWFRPAKGVRSTCSLVEILNSQDFFVPSNVGRVFGELLILPIFAQQTPDDQIWSYHGQSVGHNVSRSVAKKNKTGHLVWYR